MAKREGLLLDVIRADQFSVRHIDLITDRADQFQRHQEIARARDDIRTGRFLKGGDLFEDAEQSELVIDPSRLLEDNYRWLGRLAAYFWFDEPSTRTVGSFDAARALLGMEGLGHTNAKLSSSSAKGETLEDSLMTANEHLKFFGGGVVIIRHPQEGSADIAAEIMDFPVLNAGDGQNEHPTQALLDIYTIKQRLGRREGLNIVMGGDPKYSRTVHSLAQVLSLYPDNQITFIGEADDWLEGSATKAVLDARGVPYSTTKDLDPLKEADVVYWTRLQTERIAGQDSAAARKETILKKFAKKYAITEAILQTIPESAIIMHPLPRGPELPVSIDKDRRIAFKDQVRNGVPVRAALTEMVLRNYYIARVNEG